ncbi:MAG: adenylyl-sulfate kinase [Candidatus Omnitrophica bacterium]|nr:adenylyl-sulfate kinase [Candidatus Omnitrophota bacterium]
MKTKILWFTGLSGSGKTTIANGFFKKLEAQGQKIKIIDGDAVRGTLHKDLGFSPADIKENNRRIALMCQENVGQWDYILVPVISPFRESRDFARKLLGGAFVEVYIKTSLEECIRRDPKGLYKKALAGDIENFIGISKNTPYEGPKNPEVVVDTACEDIDAGVERIIRYMSSKEGWVLCQKNKIK